MIALCFSLTLGGLWAQQSDTRNVGDFSKVSTSGSFDLILEKGNRESVRIEMSAGDASHVITEVSGNTLKIGTSKNSWSNDRLKGTIYVTYEALEGIYQSGAGNVTCRDEIDAGRFEVSVSGSGNMYLANLDADDLQVNLSGSSNLEIGGSVGVQHITVSGSGNVDAYDLDSEEAFLRVSGSGNIRISVEDRLEARISGSGDVVYRGNPHQTDTKVSGSGRVRKA